MTLFAFLPLLWDPTMILLIPAMLFALWAQNRVRSNYGRYSRVPARSGLTGREVAQRILARRGLGEVEVRATRGQLDDHYDPRNRTVNLSPGVHDGRSLAALAIAAHETGHAMQHGEEWFPLAFRSAIAPTVGLGSTLAFPLFFVGFIFAAKIGWLMDLGIWLFALAVTIHNMPEGLSVGVAVGSGSLEVAVPLMVGIGIQNVPEGLIVSFSMLGTGRYSRWKAFLFGTVSGIVEVPLALFGAALVAEIGGLVPYAMGFAAGAMIFVISDEMIPETHRIGHERHASFGLIAGFLIMLILDVALG